MLIAAQRKSRSATARPWPVTVLGWLLLMQALALLALGTLLLLVLSVQLNITLENVWFHLPSALRGIFLVTLALLALLAAIGFFRVHPGGWLNAMLLQALMLIFALAQYFRTKPTYSYLVMAYGLFMVVYLNHDVVRAAFRPRPAVTDRGSER